MYVCVCEIEERPWGACVKSASTGSHPMSVPACVFVYVCLRPTGQCLRHGECAAHSCFSAHCRGRSGGWEDRLLTTSPFPPTPRPPFATGARCGWEERIEAERSPSPPHTSLFLNFTLCSCLLSSSSLSNSMCLSLSISVISFLSEWQRSLRFVYFHKWASDLWICSGGATD